MIKYWICTYVDHLYVFTKNKIYKEQNGFIINDRGQETTAPYHKYSSNAYIFKLLTNCNKNITKVLYE